MFHNKSVWIFHFNAWFGFNSYKPKPSRHTISIHLFCDTASCKVRVSFFFFWLTDLLQTLNTLATYNITKVRVNYLLKISTLLPRLCYDFHILDEIPWKWFLHSCFLPMFIPTFFVIDISQVHIRLCISRGVRQYF